MKYRIAWLLTLAWTWVLPAVYSQALPASDRIDSNNPRPAPDFQLPALSGPEFRLAEWKGKVILLDFWATWCEPCIAEIPVLNRLQEKYESRGLKVVGAAVQSGWRQDIQRYVAKHGIKYTVLVGKDELMETYEVLGLPTSYLIGRDGKIYRKYIGTAPGKEAEKEADLELEIERLLAR